jgi:hypothetical protein
MGVIHNFVIAGSDPPADAAGIYTAQADLEPVRVGGTGLAQLARR